MQRVDERINDLVRMRKWLRDNPDKVDLDVQPAALDWLNGEIAALSANEECLAG